MEITETMKELESDDISLNDSLSKVDKLEESFKNIDENSEISVYGEFKRVMSANSGLEQIKTISNIISGRCEQLYTDNFVLEEILAFSRAPITDCSIERSFSIFKLILSDRRHKLSADSIKYLLIIKYNKNISISV